MPANTDTGSLEKAFAASSARSLRSPFDRTMCAASFSPRNLSAAMVSPFDALSTYGLSICPGSPSRGTIFVPSPERVTIVFISWGVRFCASSTIMYWDGKLRPRMYVSGSTWIWPLSSSSA